MKKIIINESQLRLITEANGVSDKMLKVAQVMGDNIVDVALKSIIDNVSLIEEWLDDYDSEYTDSIEVDGEQFSYAIFYDKRTDGELRGEWEGDTVRLNYAFIEKAFLSGDDEDGERRLSYYYYLLNDMDTDDERDAYDYAEEYVRQISEFDAIEMSRVEIMERIVPVILHELTHGLDKDSDPMNAVWLKYGFNKIHEDDVRAFKYLFSSSEINSRVASAASLFKRYLQWNVSGQFINKHSERELFDEVIGNVLKNSELAMSEMQGYVNIIGHNSDTNKENIENCIRTRTKPYSLAYALAINDKGLYANSNASHVMRIYALDPKGFVEKVIRYYQGKIDSYKKRIYRTCYYIFMNYPHRVEDEQEA